MVTYNPKSAAPYPDSTPPQADDSSKAPEQGAPTLADLTAKIKVLEASETKAKSDLSSVSGRYQKLRRDVENGALGSSDSLTPVLAEAMVELARAHDPEGTTGVASRITKLIADGNQEAATRRQAVKETGYESTMNQLITDYGLQDNPAVKAASELYRNGRTDGDLRDAVDLVKDEAILAASQRGAAAITDSQNPTAPAPVTSPVEPTVPEAPMNPSGSGDSVMTPSAESLMDMDLDKISFDDLQKHHEQLLKARHNGDFFPNNSFG